MNNILVRLLFPSTCCFLFLFNFYSPIMSIKVYMFLDTTQGINSKKIRVRILKLCKLTLNSSWSPYLNISRSKLNFNSTVKSLHGFTCSCWTYSRKLENCVASFKVNICVMVSMLKCKG